MKRILITTLLILITCTLQAQKKNDVYVDKQGVMRWPDTKKEVMGFGVNYTVPFAHAYRSGKKLGVDLEKAIDQDVYHFARLGFDAYRVHVWDTEISDTLGNLLTNDHLKLFDYLLMRLNERGIKSILTPIAFWGNGWPEPDDPTPGFARKYGKGDCLTNEGAIKAQENYLYQFLNHVNHYTGVAYKDDPNIVAFEISNEPHHRGTPQEVTTFINRMAASIRKTGCKKPIFYNVSHSVHLGKAYFDANIQGGTFQWYPTGLGARHELRGNFLPNVDTYRMPFDNVPKFKQSAKIVYEFDAADVGRSYIYPAMARSFRTAGIQWATHFSYDPTYLAYANTEYNTHFMNLVYAPQKALSLKLAGEVFHKVPLYKTYGTYPANARFDNFYVSYEQDLAELVTETQFIYTNNTQTQVPSKDRLVELAGAGSSEIVSYEGTGAYFLDRIEPGVWRLEVMPDAVWIDNLFGRNSLEKEVAVIQWNERKMKVSLPDLGSGFVVNPINVENSASIEVNDREFNVSPGTYFIVRKGATPTVRPDSKWKNIRLNEFVAPPATVNKQYMIHQPVSSASVNRDIPITATVVTPDGEPEVELYVLMGTRPERIKMKRSNGFTYTATITGERIQQGFLSYHLVVREQGDAVAYPSGTKGHPSEWDFYGEPYQVPVLPETAGILLFDAATDADELSREWRRGSALIPLDGRRVELQSKIEALFVPDPEHANKTRIYDYSMRYNFRRQLQGRAADMGNASAVVVRGRSMNDGPVTLQVALIATDGSTFGGLLKLGNESDYYSLMLSDLKPVKMVTLPRPYPTFLDYYFETKPGESFDIRAIETIQISVGPGLSEEEQLKPQAFAIETIQLK